MMNHLMQINDRGHDLIETLTILQGGQDNNTQGDARLLGAALQDTQRMLISNLLVQLRTADATLESQDDTPAGYYQVFSGRYSGSSGLVDGGSGFTAVSGKMPFGAGAGPLPRTESMRAIRSAAAGEELFVVVYLDAATAAGIDVQVEGNYHIY